MLPSKTIGAKLVQNRKKWKSSILKNIEKTRIKQHFQGKSYRLRKIINLFLKKDRKALKTLSFRAFLFFDFYYIVLNYPVLYCLFGVGLVAKIRIGGKWTKPIFYNEILF